MKLSKKQLLTAGVFLGAFAVMNVGIYFFLRASQPKMGKRSEPGATAVHGPEVVTDTATVLHDSASTPEDKASYATVPAAPTGVDNPQHVTAETASDAIAATREVPRMTQERSSPEPTADTSEIDTLRQETAAVSTESPDEIAKLGKLLQSMKPDEAASIMTNLSTEQIITLLMRMKERNAAKIMASLPVEQAARVAAIMSSMADRELRKR